MLDKDGVVGQLYGIKKVPNIFIINPEGLIEYMGAVDSIRSSNKFDTMAAKNYLKSALKENRQFK